MKSFIKNIFVVLLFVLAVPAAHADFSSLYVFGDGLSATANNPAPAPVSNYYGSRESNGRVWIEVLAQRQGLAYDASKNISYFDHNSATLLTDVNNFKAPADITNDLFVVWVCNADIFDAVSAMNLNSSSNSIYAQLQAANNASLANHLQIITTLYAKGVRALVLPNAVDISTIPAFNGCYNPADSHFVGVMHAGCIDYNLRFSNTISQAMASCPGLQIYTPDYFALLNNVLANAPNYGLTNALFNGLSIDAADLHAFNKNFPIAATNGVGTNFIFWDPQDPTAKLHEIMADVAQQIISPVQISRLTLLNGSNQLDVTNMPVGLNGFVDGSTNQTLPNWSTVQSFNSTNTTQSIFVLTTGSSQQSQQLQQFSPNVDINPIGGTGGTGAPPVITLELYRLHFPYAWNWP